MAPLDELTEAIAGKPSIEEAVEHLVADLAARIKATSNDQNIQRLSRELKQQAQALGRAISEKSRAVVD